MITHIYDVSVAIYDGHHMILLLRRQSLSLAFQLAAKRILVILTVTVGFGHGDITVDQLLSLSS